MAEVHLLEFTTEEIQEKFPLHWCVWNDNTQKLEELLASKLYNTELADPHGRTPLLLAVALGFDESVKILLKYSCDASATDKQGWNVTQEAVGTGDPDLISTIIQHREYQRFNQKSAGITDILEALEEADDFYVEMKWEFSSWIPLISRMCPNDSYKIYKSGATVRVDTTLKGFDQMNWQRGNQSYIFKGGTRSSEFFDIDHDRKSYWKECVSIRDDTMTLDSLQPPPSVVTSRLMSQNVTSVLDHENISFTRQKAGFLGWGGDKTDNINGYEAKVYSVSGVELVTRTRTEHLSEEDILRLQEEKKEAQSKVPAVLNFFTHSEHEEEQNKDNIINPTSSNPYVMSIEEYFNPRLHPGKDVGHLRQMTSRTQKFSATVALSDEFPLSLQDQVLPIINLMANSSSHFAKLRDFITLQLPAGFPLKIEIPLFHVLNARITFSNINGVEKCPDGVVVLEEGVEKESATNEDDEQVCTNKRRCVIDKSIFDIYRSYKDLGTDVGMYRDTGYSQRDEEDELLQLAIQQSLSEASFQGEGGIDTANLPELEYRGQEWTVGANREDEELQRAIRESLQGDVTSDANNTPVAESLNEEEQLKLVMRLSAQEDEDADRRRREEEEELEKILALSLTEK